MNNFDYIAPVYDTLARLVFGRGLIEAQNTYLARIPPAARVLIMGGGSGQILLDVVQRCECEEIYYLEASQKMIALARQNMQHAHTPTRIHYLCKKEIPPFPSQHFHAILTPFVLDLFHESTLDNIFQKLSPALMTGGYWLWTDFCLPAGPKRVPAWLFIQSMYLFFKVCCGIQASKLPSVAPFFELHKLKLRNKTSYMGGMVEARLYKKFDFYTNSS